MDIYAIGAALTDIGLVREKNDDAVACEEELNFYAVSDGVGQMAFGGMTAWKCIEIITGRVEKITEDFAEDRDEEKAAERFQKAVEDVSNEIFKRGNSPEVYRYGATFCGALVLEHTIAVVNIGDSRAYVLDAGDGSLRQVTEDENLAGIVVRDGIMTMAEAKQRGLASRLVNFIGIGEASKAALTVLDKSKVKRLVLCTDGLCGSVSQEEILKELEEKDPEQTCRNLVAKAKEAGGKDNISVAVVDMKKQ